MRIASNTASYMWTKLLFMHTCVKTISVLDSLSNDVTERNVFDCQIKHESYPQMNNHIMMCNVFKQKYICVYDELGQVIW